MKATLVVLLALIALAASQCCSPTQWQGYMSGFDVARKARWFEYIYYDLENQRTRADIVADYDSTRILETYIAIYGDEKLYTIDPQTGDCTYTSLNGPMQSFCVAPGYSYQYTYTLGANLKATTYFYQDHDNYTEASWGNKDCIPIRVNWEFVHHKQFRDYAEVDFWDIQQGIQDPFVFEVPSNCQPGSSTTGMF